MAIHVPALDKVDTPDHMLVRRALQDLTDRALTSKKWASDHSELVEAITAGPFGTGLARYLGLEATGSLRDFCDRLNIVAGFHSWDKFSRALKEMFSGAHASQVDKLSGELMEHLSDVDWEKVDAQLHQLWTEVMLAHHTGDGVAAPVKQMGVKTFWSKEGVIIRACQLCNLTITQLTALRLALAMDQDDYDYVIKNTRYR